MAAPSPSAVIHGSGVTALTLARLLSAQGWQVRLATPGAVRPVQLLVGAQTAALLARLWNDDGLFAADHRIAQRLVQWGPDPATLAAAPGVSIGADVLGQRLAERLALPLVQGDPDWTIETRPVVPGDSGVVAHGVSHARVAPVRLRDGTAADTCVMQSHADGWLFLLPTGGCAASLQFMAPVDAPPPIIGSGAIGERVESIGKWSAPIPAMPRAALAPATPCRLAVGEAALGFDPISGDGVGHALRGVVLAATTLQAIADGAPMRESLASYAATLEKAMAQHLRLRAGFLAASATPPAPI